MGCLIGITAQAQPVINAEDMMPEEGIIFEMNVTELVDPGNSGENVQWNFSNLSEGNDFEAQFTDPGNVPGGENFGDANWCLTGEGFSEFYAYFGDEVYLIGQIVGDISATYSDERQMYQFPANYLDSFEDTFSRVNNIGPGNFQVYQGSYTAEIDAYGTLILAGDTIEDVLRIHYSGEATVETIVGGNSAGTSELEEDIWVWIKAGYSVPLLQITSVGGSFIQQSTIWLKSFQSTVSTDRIPELSDLNLFPSPASSHTELSFSLRSPQALYFELYSLDGKRVQQWSPQAFAAGNNTHRMELPDLAGGIYLMSIVGDDFRESRKIAIQR